MSRDNKTTVIAAPFLPLLALMFIYLKLTGAIAWSWWVLSPIWIPLAIVGVVVILGLTLHIWTR